MLLGRLTWLGRMPAMTDSEANSTSDRSAHTNEPPAPSNLESGFEH